MRIKRIISNLKPGDKFYISDLECTLLKADYDSSTNLRVYSDHLFRVGNILNESIVEVEAQKIQLELVPDDKLFSVHSSQIKYVKAPCSRQTLSALNSGSILCFNADSKSKIIYCFHSSDLVWVHEDV